MLSTIFNKIKDRDIVNGKLSLQGLSEEEKLVIGSEIRRCVLDAEVPHYKVIGIDARASVHGESADFVKKLFGFGSSYTELMLATADLIYASAAGIPNGEDMIVREDLCSKVGYLMGMGDLTSSNKALVFYGEPYNTPEPLIPDLKIARLSLTSCVLHMAIARSSGILDFDDTQSMLRGTKFKPMRVAYDFNDILSVRSFSMGDDSMMFNYKRNIDERVFSKILKDFMSEKAG